MASSNPAPTRSDVAWLLLLRSTADAIIRGYQDHPLTERVGWISTRRSEICHALSAWPTAESSLAAIDDRLCLASVP